MYNPGMIYIYDEKLDYDEAWLDDVKGMLDADRNRQLNRYKFVKDKNLCAIAYLLLKRAIRFEYGILKLPEIIIENKGKPKFESENICFNMSHCDTAVACVVDDNEVGIDIQDYSTNMINVWRQITSIREKNSIMKGMIENNVSCAGLEIDNLACNKWNDASKEKLVREITRIWTIKEAYGKYYGTGLDYPLCEKDFSFINNSGSWQNYENLKVYSKIYDKYALCVCSKKCLDIRFVSSKELILNSLRKEMVI